MTLTSKAAYASSTQTLNGYTHDGNIMNGETYSQRAATIGPSFFPPRDFHMDTSSSTLMGKPQSTAFYKYHYCQQQVEPLDTANHSSTLQRHVTSSLSRDPWKRQRHLQENSNNSLSSYANTVSPSIFKQAKPLISSQRSELIFEAVLNGLREIIQLTSDDIQQLKLSSQTPDSVAINLKSNVRYLNRLEVQRNCVDDLFEAYRYNLLRKDTAALTKPSMRHSSLATKAMLNDINENLTKIETDLHMFLGSFDCEIKGVAGFARLVPKDTFDLVVKMGQERFKARGRVEADRSQTWDVLTFSFKASRNDIFEFKVSEVKGLGKSTVLVEKTYDTLELFTGPPQLLTVFLNRTGSLKLNLLITWNPTSKSVERAVSSAVDNAWNLSINKSMLSPICPPNFGALSRSREAVNNGDDKEKSVTTTTFSPATTVQYASGNHSDRQTQAATPMSTSSADTDSGFSASRSVSSRSQLFVAARDFSSRNQPLQQPLLLLASLLREKLSQLPQLSTLLRTVDELCRFFQATDKNGDEQEQFQYTVSSSPPTNPGNSNFSSPFNAGSGSSTLSGYSSLFPGTLPRRLRQHAHAGRMKSYDNSNAATIMTSTMLPGSYACNTVDRRRTSKLATTVYIPEQDQVRTLQQLKNLRRSEGCLPEACSASSASVGIDQHRPALMSEQAASGGSDQVSSRRVELERCLLHHVTHCQVLVQKLSSSNNQVLAFRQSEVLQKLNDQVSMLDHISTMFREPLIPEIGQVLARLGLSAELKAVWFASSNYKYRLNLRSEELRKELERSYGQYSPAKYGSIFEKVFQKLLHQLTDQQRYNPSTVTLFQFAFYFRDKNVPSFVESLANEVWTVENLSRNDCPSSVQLALERLKTFTVAPPIDCVRHVAMLLCSESKKLQLYAEGYLLFVRRQLHRREDLINLFLALLEHEDPITRTGSCKALTVIGARRAIPALVHLSRSDRKSRVREEARLATLSFGDEGKLALDDVARIAGDDGDEFDFVELRI